MKIPPFFCPHASSGANTRVFSVLHTSLTISHLHHPNNPYRPFRLSKEPLPHPQRASFAPSKSLFRTLKKPIPHPQRPSSAPPKNLSRASKPRPVSSKSLSHTPTPSLSHLLTPSSLSPHLPFSSFPLSNFFTMKMNVYAFSGAYPLNHDRLSCFFVVLLFFRQCHFPVLRNTRRVRS